MCTYGNLNQGKAIQHTYLNISFSIDNEKEAAQVGFESTTYSTAYKADVLPTELPRQLSWLSQIKAIQGKGNQSNLT